MTTQNKAAELEFEAATLQTVVSLNYQELTAKTSHQLVAIYCWHLT